ncbi:14472_t:CDS:2 [Cetraspora pellucida]|uniref:14472_t:CDS:1 n=1 Tax=Cetraspora pellucida TaxID=1433469 RepID=A0ACA9N6I8_9GLOM|nr:14472_t:CDS:2 [Cetraspora pellucida]
MKIKKVKLDKLQQDFLQYYKKIIDQTDILLQLLEIQIAIAIEEEKNIEKLKNTWSEAIDKLEQEYLTNDQNKLILQQLLNKRIEELQNLPPIELPKWPPPERSQAKHPIEEVENNYLTTNPDKAEPNHNLAESAEKQILDIISQYRKTLVLKI